MGRLRRKSQLVVAALTLCPLALSQAQFKTTTTLVRHIVTVKDPQGNLIGSLDKSAFKVFDCGVAQEVAVFEKQTALPLSVSILLDTSGSTAKDLNYEVTSIDRFLKALLGAGNDKDAASLYSFNTFVTLLSSFTRRQARLTAALKDAHPSGGTSLYDAIVLASDALKNREGRHVMIVVTDGGDTISRYKYADALRSAHSVDAVIYPILVLPVTNDPGRNVGGENALAAMAAGTGGRVSTPAANAELDKVFAGILDDLRTQYLVGYYPKDLPPDAPKFHPVRVQTVRPELRVLARTGYYGN